MDEFATVCRVFAPFLAIATLGYELWPLIIPAIEPPPWERQEDDAA